MMKEIMFALWGAVIASGWWAIGVLAFPGQWRQGTLLVTVIASISMVIFVIVRGLQEYEQ